MTKKLIVVAALALSLLSGCAELTYDQQQALIQSLGVLENSYRQHGVQMQQMRENQYMYEMTRPKSMHMNCYTSYGTTICNGSQF